MRTIIPLNDGWYFTLADRDENNKVDFDHSGWDRVTLPHDWSLPLGYDREAPSGGRWGFVRGGMGWYRRIIQADKALLQKKALLEFDGIFSQSDVYVNGAHLGFHPYGYTPVAYDISEHLKEGINVVAVRVDCRNQPSSRWYSGCGIYRPVRMILTEPIHVNRGGTYITTPVIDEDKAKIRIETEIVNDTEKSQPLLITHTIIDGQGNEMNPITVMTDTPTGITKIQGQGAIEQPKLWSPSAPNLYRCLTEISLDGKKIDRYETRFGIRKTEFIPGQGFFLNGENLKFKGVCLHHDAGVAGAALTDDYREKRLRLLKRMGCNAVRTSHNPFSPGFYDLCDELGLMVMDEIFDGWDEAKADFDYGHHFADWHERDLTDFIRRDRNHPSIMIWSIGNEVPRMKKAITVKLRDMVHELDPTRPVTCGVQGTGELYDENRALLDVAGYNDGGGACFIYDEDHEKRPDQLFIATEAPHTYQTRDFYRTQTWWRDKNKPRQEIENLTEEEIFTGGHINYRSSYDNSGVRTCIRDSWTLTEERPWLMGEFRWTGFDYHGESYGWPSRWAEHGIIGMENYPKDSYYLYQSMWAKEPMIHLLPHWTHPELEPGTVVPLWIYTNCEEAELFLNGTSLGRRERNGAKHLPWDVPYEPGEIRAVGYNKGKAVAEKSRITGETPAALSLASDWEKTRIRKREVVQIDFTLLDKGGNPTPRGENVIHCAVCGPVSLMGMENGDAVDLTPVVRPFRRAFYGRAMALIRIDSSEQNEPIPNEPAAVYAASLLGDKIFTKETTVTLDAKELVLWGKKPPADLRLRWRFGEDKWSDYKGPRIIKESTQIEAQITLEGKILFSLSALFIKGEREKIIDLTHGNKAVQGEVPLGPFAKELRGDWSDGEFSYRFKKDGKVSRVLNASSSQDVGYWWYDFPLDPFEAQEDAGQGEIWFASGERCPLKLSSQVGKELIMDNSSQAVAAPWGFPKEITLIKEN